MFNSKFDHMNQTVASAGNNGDKDRSDCLVTIELSKSGGLKIDLQSKVQVLYGESIEALSKEVLNFFDIRHATLTVIDKGALPFVLAARIEAAIKQVISTEKEYLLDMISENRYSTQRNKPRISRLYLPGNTPSLMLNAGVHKPDGIILDLEDAVAITKKSEARILVRNALRSHDFLGVERMVRINQIPMGLDDLEFVVPHHVNVVLIPKCESAEHIQQVNDRISAIKRRSDLKDPIWLMPIIESAMGVMKALKIAQAADNVVAMAIGLEDYTADIGVNRTKEGRESLFARCQIINACKAAGIQAIDSVFSDVGDMDALKENVLQSKALGFEGMGCIHPRQIKVIHENFAPNEVEIEKAKKIVLAFEDAAKKGLGVVSLGTKMIDAPVVKRAQHTIDSSISVGKLNKNWRNEIKD
ncbi:MAG TPA: aldolase/citrate lyase family protein [Cyclobacteriaceae bacterium]|nr:aldolase/citrate lyase family protein [Cyclobacteriaceae bacterium]